jgi:hypothetical protein
VLTVQQITRSIILITHRKLSQDSWYLAETEHVTSSAVLRHQLAKWSGVLYLKRERAGDSLPLCHAS